MDPYATAAEPLVAAAAKFCAQADAHGNVVLMSPLWQQVLVALCFIVRLHAEDAVLRRML